METKDYQVVIGLAIAIVVLLIVVTFIAILVLYSNKRKRAFKAEKLYLQQQFNEQLLQSQLEIQEQTFDSISQEIHDNVGQVLSLAKVQLNILGQRQLLDLELVNDLKEGISKAMIDLRDIAKSLNSGRISLSSLPEITRHELQRISRLGTIKTMLHVEGTEQPVAEQKKLFLLRMLQESLQNILKHAQAKNIDVFCTYGVDQLQLKITDDGIGFNQVLQQQSNGLGLQNIISRAALIGGQASINSIINQGTTITIILPYA